MFRKIRQFMTWPKAGKRIFIKICLLVPVIEIGLKMVGFKRTYGILNYFVKPPKNKISNSISIIRDHTYFLDLFIRHLPFSGNCLARSLTLWLFLKNLGVDTDLRFGMKKEKEKLIAHAWLEFEGKPLASETEIDENYTFFPESILSKLVK